MATGGYNVATREYTDLIKVGVLDPAKVTRSALQNAASISGLLLTTECMVTEIPEKTEAPMPGEKRFLNIFYRSDHGMAVMRSVNCLGRATLQTSRPFRARCG